MCLLAASKLLLRSARSSLHLGSVSLQGWAACGQRVGGVSGGRSVLGTCEAVFGLGSQDAGSQIGCSSRLSVQSMWPLALQYPPPVRCLVLRLHWSPFISTCPPPKQGRH